MAMLASCQARVQGQGQAQRQGKGNEEGNSSCRKESTSRSMRWIFLGLCWALLACVAWVVPGAAAAKPAPRREDVPLIKCQVCEAMAASAVAQVKDLRQRTAPKKVSELKVLGVVEKICNLKWEEGDWIQWFDIVERGDVLELEKQPYKGECGEECKTIEKACNEVIGFVDTDVAEHLHVHPDITAKELAQWLCKEHTGACKGKRPKIPKGRKPGPAFVRKSEKELEREAMLRNIEGKQELFAEEHPDAPRMPKMKLYSRDDIMKKTMFTGREGEEEEDEDEDEDGGPLGGEGLGGGAEEGSFAGGTKGDEELLAISRAMKEAEASEAAQKAKSTPKSADTGSGEGTTASRLSSFIEAAQRTISDGWTRVSTAAGSLFKGKQEGSAPRKKSGKAEL